MHECLMTPRHPVSLGNASHRGSDNSRIVFEESVGAKNPSEKSLSSLNLTLGIEPDASPAVLKRSIRATKRDEDDLPVFRVRPNERVDPPPILAHKRHTKPTCGSDLEGPPTASFVGYDIVLMYCSLLYV